MSFRSLALLLTVALSIGVARADAVSEAGPAAPTASITQNPPVADIHAAPAADTWPVVDRVVLHKSERRLMLMHGGNVVRSYRVALGLNPIGQKERSGDFRTPEGTYRLEQRNPRSDFFLSIKVSYPNQSDVKRAHSRHWDSGGSIMIHGLPNLMKHDPDYYAAHDWTDGCIAVTNADMVEIWMLTPDDVPIDIYP